MSNPEPILVYRKTEDLIGRDFIDFMRTLPNPPRAIISLADVTSDGNPLRWLANQGRLSHIFESASVDSTTGSYAQAAIYHARNNNAAALRGKGIIIHQELGAHEQALFPFPVFEQSFEFIGSAQDLEKYILLHEQAHMGHPSGEISSREMRFFEEEADRFANKYYYEAYRQGLVSDPEIPYAFRAIRAIITVSGEDLRDIYILNGLSPLPGEHNAFGGSTPIREDVLAIYDSMNRLYEIAGHDLVIMTPMMQLRAIYNTQNAYIDDVEQFIIPEDLNEQIIVICFNKVTCYNF